MPNNAANDRRIDYIELQVTDVAAAKRFYGDVFGWSFTDWGDEYASFEDGRMNGGFAKSDSVTPGGPLVIMYATDLEAALARVKKAGGRIVVEPFSFPGGRRFHFADPSGNVLAVWSEQ
jgi:predicted enzyme related to lactoylglutathione lyase